MSTPPAVSPRLSVPAFTALKGERPLVCLTAYTTSTAARLDPHVDLLLVGDSLGMVVYGEESTLAVSLDDMIRHGRAVVRGSSQALVVVDLPFGSYQASPAQAFDSAARVIRETGASAIKLEGGAAMAETIAFLVARGIPVMGHVGLMPQHVHSLGGYRWQGRDDAQRQAIRDDAATVADAGAFALVLEGIDAGLASEITAELAIPTIGIGAGAECDGQVLVVDDMAGFTTRTARFVKRYSELGEALSQAAAAYAGDVRAGRFPEASHSYGVSLSPSSKKDAAKG